MAISYYKGFDTYIVYDEETSYGAGATPVGTNRFGRVTNVTLNMANNSFRSQGMGEGRNATGGYLGNFDVNGSIEGELCDLDWMQYAIGTRTGAGVVADPYELTEIDNIGYAGATEIPTLGLEIGSEGGSNDDTLDVTGVVFNSLSITATVGEPVKFTTEFVGKTVASATTLTAYTAPTAKTLTFQDATVTVGSDEWHCTSFTWTINNNMSSGNRILGDRTIQQPTTGMRRYDFTVTMRKKFDDTASTLSGTEARSLFFDGSTGTAPLAGAQATAVAVSLDLIEGAAADDRVINIDMQNCYIDSWSEPIALDSGVIEVTINGYGLSGLIDSTVYVPIRYYTIA